MSVCILNILCSPVPEGNSRAFTVLCCWGPVTRLDILLSEIYTVSDARISTKVKKKLIWFKCKQSLDSSKIHRGLPQERKTESFGMTFRVSWYKPESEHAQQPSDVVLKESGLVVTLHPRWCSTDVSYSNWHTFTSTVLYTVLYLFQSQSL